jgi:hypothetical protein
MKTIKRIKSTALNKGRARVWIEDANIGQYGFKRGAPVTITIGNGRILVKTDPAGDRIVAGRERGGKSISILDICFPNAEREAMRFNCSKFLVSAEQGVLMIEADLSTQEAA